MSLLEKYRAYYATPSGGSFLSLMREVLSAPENELVRYNRQIGQLYLGRRAAEPSFSVRANNIIFQRLFNPNRRNLIHLAWDYDPEQGLAASAWEVRTDEVTNARTVRADWYLHTRSLIGLLDDIGVAVALTCEPTIAKILLEDAAVDLRIQAGLIDLTTVGDVGPAGSRSAIWVPETGLNHFTCRFGVRHLYPTFYLDEGGHCLNLLAPTDTRHSLDLVSYSVSEYECECGRQDIGLSVVRNVADRLWVDGQMVVELPPLTGQYKAISLVASGNEARCMFVRKGHETELPIPDREVLESLVKRPVVQLPNTVLKNSFPYNSLTMTDTGIAVWPARE